MDNFLFYQTAESSANSLSHSMTAPRPSVQAHSQGTSLFCHLPSPVLEGQLRFLPQGKPAATELRYPTFDNICVIIIFVSQWMCCRHCLYVLLVALCLKKRKKKTLYLNCYCRSREFWTVVRALYTATVLM